MSITTSFSLWESKPRVEVNSESKVIFESTDLPLTKTAIILLLIIWQLAAFHLTARRENLLGWQRSWLSPHGLGKIRQVR